ncbi:epoxyqueuosine reductase [Bacteroidia bacterium]|nr:epoxyqueuosine reductase [Bacteroidia bacterium]
MIDAQQVKLAATQVGWDACGLVALQSVDEVHRQAFLQWLRQGQQAQMAYLELNTTKHLHPQQWLPEMQTLIVLLWQYRPAQWQDEHLPQIACYAYGQDYHSLLKKKLRELLQYLQAIYPALTGRAFVDTAPLLERHWAMQAGLGFIGNNAMLIHPQMGSFVFIASLAVNDAANVYDRPLQPTTCEDCGQCAEACPARAIVAPRVIDARRCIAYWTIEAAHWGIAPAQKCRCGYIFGCDICQKVCPHNKQPIVNIKTQNAVNQKLMQMTAADWQNIDEASLGALTRHSALRRAGFRGIKSNLQHYFF